MQVQIKTSFNHPQPSNEPEGPQPEQKFTFWRLFRFATTSDKVLIVVGTVFSCFMGAALPTFAHLMGNMLDSFAFGSDRYEASKKNLLNFIYLGLAAFTAGTIMYSTWGVSGERQSSRCRKEYFKSLIRQQIGWFDTQKQAEIASNFSLDALSFQQAIGQRISTLIMLISMVFTGLGVALYNGWILTLVLLCYLPFLMLAWTYNIVTKHKVFKERNQIFTDSDIKAQETLSSIKLVKQMNAQTFEEQIQLNIMDNIARKYGDTTKNYAVANIIAVAILNVGFVMTFWYGSQCVFDNGACPQSISTAPYTGGAVIKIFYALFLPTISLNQIVPSFQKIVEGMSAATRIYKIIDRVPEIRSKENPVIPASYSGFFEFANVTFGYPKDKSIKILKNFSMKIDCKHLGIIGKSGCGKSTIFQLIMRFYDPDEGTIYLDGNDLRDLDLDWLRSQIGYVGQQPVLFATSIRENLLLARPEASERDINEALAKAEAQSFVMKLPDGLGTFVGSEGSQLSGGQKQRIAIARALLKNPKLLLLDEATSALDRVNQQQILATISRMQRSFQSISITHRKRVLRTCEKVFQFGEKGVKVVKLDVEKGGSKTMQTEEIINSSLLISTTKAIEVTHAEEIKPLAVNNENEEGMKKKEIKEVDTSSKLSNIIPFLLEYKCYLGVSLLFCLLDGVAFPTTGVIVSKVLSSLLQYNHQQTYKYLIGLGVMTAIAPITNTTAVSLGSITGQKVVKQIRTSIFAKLLRLPVSWYQREENQPQKVITKLTSSCKTLHSFLSLQSPVILSLIVNVLAGIAGGIAFEWRTGLTSIGLIPLIILSQAIQLGFIQGFAEKKGKIYESSSQIINESILNIRTVLSLGGFEPFQQRYSDKIDQIYEQVSTKCFFSGFMYGISNFLQYLTFGVVLFLATVFVVNYPITIDNSLSSIFLILFACISAGNKVNLIQDLEHLKEGSRWIFSMLELKDEHELLKEEGRKQLKNQIRGNIEFKHVSFRYENREAPVLDDLNISVKEGEEIYLVGKSGCGKSTVISLLLGFYSPTQGQILLEGIDIRDYDLHHLRKSFGVVSQQPVLFNEAIDWNIRYNQQQISDEDVRAAAKSANFNPDQQKFSEETSPVTRQPLIKENKVRSSENLIIEEEEIKREGFKKIVGPKGSHVSGGQKQRIAIARAILRHPAVLLLDQATSALDPQNQQKVQQSLDRLMKDKTTINITHRLQIIGKEKKVYVLVQGKVMQEDTCDRLIAARGVFCGMYTGQQQAQ